MNRPVASSKSKLAKSTSGRARERVRAPSKSKANARSLEHYEQVSLYEASFRSRTEDITYFRTLAEKVGGPILEFGAGTGRVTLPLARAGFDVVAVDKSRAMLNRLRAHRDDLSPEERSRVTAKYGDMRRMKLGRTFPLVLATFNVVGHLRTYQDMGAFIRTARAHLKKSGTLAFDVLLPHPDEVEADPEELVHAPRFKHPEFGHWMRQSERFEYNPLTQELLVESTFSAEGAEGSITVPLVLRQWFPKEVEAILRYEGFEHIETHADYAEVPGLLAKDTLIFLARR